jgi:hypothetical protein
LIGDVAKKGTPASYDNRVETSGGDFFESVPNGGDLYLLKFILHDWDDDHSVKILRNVRRAIADGGKRYSLDRCRIGCRCPLWVISGH